MSTKITFTILSISLLTVMAGAAVAPALGTIQQHFSDSPETLVRFIVSIPALFIIVTNLLFSIVCRFLRTRSLALFGLILYVACGMGAFFADNIVGLLVLRALLGVSVGFLMPLSTGLLVYYNPPEKIADLLGVSAAMNQMGGVLATLLAGFLATIGWNFSFLVYGLGLIVVGLVVCYLPNESLSSPQGRKTSPLVIMEEFHPFVTGMILCMGLFFVFVSNFSITENAHFSTMHITYLMMGVDVVALVVGLCFGRLMKGFPRLVAYLSPMSYAFAFILLAYTNSLASTTTALMLIGIANGVGIPYMNTKASLHAGRDRVNIIMPIMSAALYLGQFISPLLVGLFSNCFVHDPRSPYKTAIVFSLIYLLQVAVTKRSQFQFTHQ